MTEKDFERISVGEIAARANINRVTFYRHYLDKYDWLEHCISELLFVPEGNTIPLRSAGDAHLFDALVATFRRFQQDAPLYAILLNNKGTRFFQERFKIIQIDYLYRVLGPQYPKSDLLDLEIHYVASAAVGCMEWWIQNNCPLSPEEMAKKMIHIHQQLLWGRIDQTIAGSQPL